MPVEVVFFRPPAGLGADTVRLYDAIGLFREPLVGLEPQLAGVEEALEARAFDPSATLSSERIDSLLSEARAARTRIREAAFHELHRDRYQAEMAEGILSRVPSGLDPLNEEVVTVACERLGFGVERHRGRRRYSIEFGNEALVDSLPGVPGGTSFLGTFDREEAVDDETLDFFAAGHPLVEGILAHLEESPRGRVGVVGLGAPGPPRLGLAAFYKDGPAFDVTVVDSDGRRRPDWATVLRRRPVRVRRMPGDPPDPDAWAESVRRMGAQLDPERRPVALAVVLVDGQEADAGP
jgi:ATP-dependent helicase HepA